MLPNLSRLTLSTTELSALQLGPPSAPSTDTWPFVMIPETYQTRPDYSETKDEFDKKLNELKNAIRTFYTDFADEIKGIVDDDEKGEITGEFVQLIIADEIKIEGLLDAAVQLHTQLGRAVGVVSGHVPSRRKHHIDALRMLSYLYIVYYQPIRAIVQKRKLTDVLPLLTQLDSVPPDFPHYVLRPKQPTSSLRARAQP